MLWILCAASSQVKDPVAAPAESGVGYRYLAAVA